VQSSTRLPSYHTKRSDMKLFQILRILGTATSVSPTIVSDPPGPASEHVRVVGLSLLGSGCPPGSTDVQVDATNTLMEITFSQYIVQTGPDISPADSRKNCNLKISMEFDAGFQQVSLQSASSTRPSFTCNPQAT